MQHTIFSACFNCHKEGHIARHCPEESECYRCGKAGHIARHCTEDVDESNDGRYSKREIGAKECYICGSTDHIQAQCPDATCYR